MSLGIHCETPNEKAKELFKIIGKGTGTEQHRHHTVDVAVYNMLSYLYELENTKVYKMTKNNDIYRLVMRNIYIHVLYLSYINVYKCFYSL